ncbi:ribbon-helix-helix protein, CopG family [Candidatus Uabimicrobium sp. HlEnr_7]|uniref:ribbon-helix-helix protein, CopG family n=1 Tax=Candidatus Uabimicrobium helgolandensis TaxID=3095367 RepID=UPI00355739B4
MQKERISITIQKDLCNEIHRYTKAKNISRSEFIEQVLLNWEKEYKRQQMIEGYKMMAKENSKIAQDFSALSQESWPDE